MVIRPVLDTFQTIPPFVYLVPALALFGASRFTAIVAALAYAVPIATKLVADGIRGVSPSRRSRPPGPPASPAGR